MTHRKTSPAVVLVCRLAEGRIAILESDAGLPPLSDVAAATHDGALILVFLGGCELLPDTSTSIARNALDWLQPVTPVRAARAAGLTGASAYKPPELPPIPGSAWLSRSGQHHDQGPSHIEVWRKELARLKSLPPQLLAQEMEHSAIIDNICEHLADAAEAGRFEHDDISDFSFSLEPTDTLSSLETHLEFLTRRTPAVPKARNTYETCFFEFNFHIQNRPSVLLGADRFISFDARIISDTASGSAREIDQTDEIADRPSILVVPGPDTRAGRELARHIDSIESRLANENADYPSGRGPAIVRRSGAMTYGNLAKKSDLDPTDVGFLSAETAESSRQSGVAGSPIRPCCLAWNGGDDGIAPEGRGASASSPDGRRPHFSGSGGSLNPHDEPVRTCRCRLEGRHGGQASPRPITEDGARKIGVLSKGGYSVDIMKVLARGNATEPNTFVSEKTDPGIFRILAGRDFNFIGDGPAAGFHDIDGIGSLFFDGSNRNDYFHLEDLILESSQHGNSILKSSLLWEFLNDDMHGRARALLRARSARSIGSSLELRVFLEFLAAIRQRRR